MRWAERIAAKAIAAVSVRKMVSDKRTNWTLLFFKNDSSFSKMFNKLKKPSLSKLSLKEQTFFIKRLSFLLIFGTKFHMSAHGKFNAVDVIIGGDEMIPIKIKN